MENNIHFIYLVNSDTASFKLCHYLSIKSFLCYSSAKVYFYTNQAPTYSTWYWRLLKEYPERFIPVVNLDPIFEDCPKEWKEYFIKIPLIYHQADLLRLVIVWKYGGLYSDLDMVAIKKIDDFFYYNLPVYPVELDADNHFAAIPNGFFWAPKNSSWIQQCIGLYENYDPQSWSGTSIEGPTKLYFEDKSRIKVVPAGLFDPVTYKYEDRRALFFHNSMRFKDSYTFHYSESMNKDILSYLDLEHIMTVDTTFTNYTRQFVAEYWDSKNNRPIISKYE